MFSRILKPTLYFLLSFSVLLFLSPLFLIITFSLTIPIFGNPFFTQVRPSKNARLFSIVKFKAINDKRDTQGKLLPDAE